jgi:probable phosphomutase (TIGR03848 family)
LTTLILIRHAQNDWVRTGKLAGWTPDVHLNEEGIEQAKALGRRLAHVNLKAVYSSPLERAVETAHLVLSHHPDLDLQIEEGIGEVDFGSWTGERLRKLSRTRLWKVVQRYPSDAQFPSGESIHQMQFRVISTLGRLAARHPNGPLAIVSHSDVLKAAVAYYAGMPLDMFQRLVISPASISVIRLHRMGPRIIKLNDTSHYDQPADKTPD